MVFNALIGHSGFVGSALKRKRRFEALYNSKNFNDIIGCSYDTVICAAAPATMWAANQNPAADKANLDRLADCLAHVKAGCFVLISTIAVFADPAAGDTESAARYETSKPYGRHRRELEERCLALFPRCHVLRLPALFGPGLKKNFIFDLLNPLPSFIKPQSFEALRAQLPSAPGRLLEKWWRRDESLGMWALDRAGLAASRDQPILLKALASANFAASRFTNSASRFQYYNIDRLALDIDRVAQAGLRVVNICSQPLEARRIHRELTGLEFANEDPPLYREDVHSDHAPLFGSQGPYLFDADSVLADLRAYFETERREMGAGQ